jgi:hypothetical protein
MTDNYTIQNFLENNTDISKLSTEISDSLEGLITYNEIRDTLNNMKNDKSPGSDGFSANLFKSFLE